MGSTCGGRTEQGSHSMEGLKAAEDRAMVEVGLILGSLRGRGDVGSKIGLEEMANRLVELVWSPAEGPCS